MAAPSTTPEWLPPREQLTLSTSKTYRAQDVKHNLAVITDLQEALTTAEELLYSRIEQSQDPSVEPDLPFEAAALIVLVCSGGRLSISELLSKVRRISLLLRTGVGGTLKMIMADFQQ